MNRFGVFLILAFLGVSTVAVSQQEVTAKLVLQDSVKDCAELQYACMQLIPLYYQDGLLDTAGFLLDHWEKRCGRDETIYRTRVLFAIDNGTFGDTLIGDETIGFLDTYQRFSSDTTGESMQEYYYYTPEFELLRWYKSFTDSIAVRALSYPDLAPVERFYISFYLHPQDSAYRQLESKELENSRVRGIYEQPVRGKMPGTLFHYAGSAGMWLPFDRLSTLGNHPSLGGYAGFRKNKMFYNLSLNFRVGGAKNDYEVLYKDSLYTTENFTGINIGIEAGRNLINWRRHEFGFLGGIDFESINVLYLENDPDSDEDDESKFITSPSIHVGAGYRYYLANERYIGLSSRYHLLNFKNKGGTNLRGNAVSVTLEYGFGKNRWLNNRNTYLRERLPRSGNLEG